MVLDAEVGHKQGRSGIGHRLKAQSVSGAFFFL
jgi:hypothetical protein